MAQVTFRNTDGTETPVRIRPGKSLMEGALSAGVRGIQAKCGGMAACATCHILLEPEWAARLAGPRALEETMLANLRGRQDTSRLACQIKMRDELDGMVVTVPEAQGLAPSRRADKAAGGS